MICYLIERHYSSALHFWVGKPGHQLGAWTSLAADAVRFARREDANAMLTWHLEGIGNVVEHEFVERSDPPDA